MGWAVFSLKCAAEDTGVRIGERGVAYRRSEAAGFDWTFVFGSKGF